jgi:hypothetical protein
MESRARLAAAILATALTQSVAAQAAAPPPTPAGYSQAVTQICRGALLFDGTHPLGTRAGAIAVSNDIRATGGLRLRRVDALPKPPETALLAARWVATERRLVKTYAWAYLQIWHQIENARTPRQRAKLPAAVHAVTRKSDTLQHEAALLERALNVPDCTGGSTQPPPSDTAAAQPPIRVSARD